MEKYGHPIGNINLRRRFTQEELDRINAGENPQELIEQSVQGPNYQEDRETLYNNLFGDIQGECFNE
jgi:hypothetical protein